MNKSLFKRMTLILGLWLAAFGMQGQERVTLNQCYTWAQENYPLIRQYGLIEQTEQFNLANATKGWLPQLSINAKATYQSDVTKLPFDVDKLSAVMPGLNIPTLSKDQYQAVTEVNQSIWDGGMIRSARVLTQAEAEANRKQLESDLYALNERVNQLYFGCLLQNELLRQNALLQEQLQLNTDRVSSLIVNGMANQSDLESMQVELLNVRQQAIELTASRTAYLRMLATLTGHSLTESAALQIPVLPGEALSSDIHRPELSLMDARGRLLEAQNQQLTAGIMPRLGLFVQGGYGRPGLNMLENEFNPFYIAGVRFSWNLGKLYTLRDDRRKVDVSRRSVEVQRETFLFNTQLEQQQQQTEIEKINALMRADEEILRLRTSIREAAEVKLANGVIDVTDLIREINAESLARQTGATRRMQELMAIYTYLHTTGNHSTN